MNRQNVEVSDVDRKVIEEYMKKHKDDDIITVQPEDGVKEQAGAIAGLPDQATIDKARKVTSRN